MAKKMNKAQLTAQQRRRERALQRERERKRTIMILVLLCLLIVGGVGAGIFLFLNLKSNPTTQQTKRVDSIPAVSGESETAAGSEADGSTIVVDGEGEAPAEAAPAPVSSDLQSVLDQAAYTAAGYDYDGAIAMLQQVAGYESQPEITAKISEYEAQKAACVPVDVNNVTHIFYHSLVNDPGKAFDAAALGESAANGMNAWMTTMDEFQKITQSMYDRGFVMVRLRDLVISTTDENGKVHFEPNNNLMLPEGKTPYVLSVDDLSYYHSYEAASFPDKLIVDETGRVRCHYVTADGVEHVGDYDVVPWMETFLREHPDGAYKGARGLIALTGYNGVLGYRTDIDYLVREKLIADQEQWLNNHPDFDYEQEIADATVVADAIKADGWEFASHTWGHLSVTGKTAEELKVDNEKWMNTVANIVGPTDTIIFAHGNDIGDWTGYSSDNSVYNYFKSAGYNFYCNVDSSVPAWVQITGDYVRQGRIDVDGYLMYQAKIGNTDVLNRFFDINEVFDSRRPTPVIALGE